LKYIAKGVIQGFPVFLSSLLVQQEVVGNNQTAIEQVLASDTLRANLLREEQEILNSPESGENGAKRLVEIYQRLSEIDANSAEKRALEILTGLSFSKKMMVKN
jgi:ATPase subunit of ABC transporter with duplicated ATPase domains